MLARDPLTGERDLRSEDRQLLLDAVLAATETLVVTYTGANEHTGAAAAARRTARRAARRPRPHRRRRRCATRSLVRHPLQPYDARNFVPGALVGERRRSASTGPRSPARGRRAPAAAPPPPLLDGPLPAPRAGPPTSSLADLQAFFAHPVRGVPARPARRRHAARAPTRSSDAMPVDLDALEQWAVGDRLLRDVLAGRRTRQR